MSEVDGESNSESSEPKRAAKPAVKPAAPPPAPVTVLQWVMLFGVAGATAALDLWSKAWAIKKLSAPMSRTVPLCTPPPGMDHYLNQHYPTHPIVLIQNYLELHYAENCGGAFGLLAAAREGVRKPFFLAVTVGAVAFIIYLYRSLESGQKAMRLALPLVLGGAIGNLVDRMRLGYVVDFIDAHMKDRYHWPTFNVADIAITVGIALMILEYILGGSGKKTPVKPRPAKSATAAR